MPPLVKPKQEQKKKHMSETKKVAQAAKSNKPKVETCTAGVRFDRERGQWGILNPDMTTKQSFERGIILEATMEAKSVRKGVGCGSHTDVIGVAYGDITMNSYGGPKVPKTGFKNLEFKDGVFVNGDGERIETASVIRLMPDRKAQYRP